jgi:hypothetical protein
MTTRHDIEALENALKNAHKAGDIASAKALAQALSGAKDEFTPAQQPEPEPIEPKGLLGAIGSGVKTQLGSAGRQMQNIGSFIGTSGSPLGEEASIERQRLSGEEEAAQERFRQETAEHPIAGGVGKMLPFLPFAAGGTPTAAMLRGAAAGGLLQFDDPENTAFNSTIGAVGNRLGLNLLGKAEHRIGLKTDRARLAEFGMVGPPEVRGAGLVPFPKSAQKLSAFQSDAFKFSQSNIENITEETLKSLGVGGARFRADTFERSFDASTELFKKATNTKGHVPLVGFKNRLNRFISSEEEQLLDDKPTIRFLKKMQDRLDEPGRQDLLTSKEYQDFRSRLGKKAETFGKKKAQTRAAMYALIDSLDDTAAATLPPSARKDFREARRIWRNMQLFKKPSVVDEHGYIKPKQLRNMLTTRDENRYLFRKGEQPKLYEMLRLEYDIPSGAPTSGLSASGRYSQTGGGLILSGLKSALGRPLLGTARLPTRAVEGAPLGLTVPNIPTLNLNPLLQE